MLVTVSVVVESIAVVAVVVEFEVTVDDYHDNDEDENTNNINTTNMTWMIVTIVQHYQYQALCVSSSYCSPAGQREIMGK